MATTANIKFQADTAAAIAAIGALNNKLSELTKTATTTSSALGSLGSTNITNSLTNLSSGLGKADASMSSLSKTAGLLKSALAAAASVQFLSSLAKLSDEVTIINNNLKQFSTSQEEVNQKFTMLASISKNTGTSMSAVGEIYTTFMKVSKELGITNEHAARMTETLSKTFAMAGMSAAETSGALIQFTQGLQQGRFSGDELNSMLERTPDLARALAASLGVTVGELKKIASENKIMATDMINAIDLVAATTDAKFGGFNRTISQSFESLKTSSMVAWNEIEKNSQVGQKVAHAIIAIGDAVESVGKSIDKFTDIMWGLFKVAAVVTSIFVGSRLFGGLAAALASAYAGFRLVSTAISALGFGVPEALAPVIASMESLTTLASSMGGAIGSALGYIGAALGLPKLREWWDNLGNAPTLDKAKNELLELGKAGEISGKQLEDFNKKYQDVLNEMQNSGEFTPFKTPTDKLQNDLDKQTQLAAIKYKRQVDSYKAMQAELKGYEDKQFEYELEQSAKLREEAKKQAKEAEDIAARNAKRITDAESERARAFKTAIEDANQSVAVAGLEGVELEKHNAIYNLNKSLIKEIKDEKGNIVGLTKGLTEEEKKQITAAIDLKNQKVLTAGVQRDLLKSSEDLALATKKVGTASSEELSTELKILDAGRKYGDLLTEELKNKIRINEENLRNLQYMETINKNTQALNVPETGLKAAATASGQLGQLDPVTAAMTQQQTLYNGLEELRQKDLISEQQYQTAKQNAAIATQQAIYDANKKQMEDSQFLKIKEKYGTFLSYDQQKEAAKSYADFEMKTTAEKTSFALENLTTMFSAMGAQNKKAFEAQKALGIATALVNTYTSVTKAMAAYPFPFNLLAAAGALAAGMVQVNAIRSQQYSGKFKGGDVGGGMPYMVGEKGPEVFVPSSSGSIIPNDKLGQGGVNVNFTINAVDASSFDELLVQRKGVIQGIISDAMQEKGQRF